MIPRQEGKLKNNWVRELAGFKHCRKFVRDLIWFDTFDLMNSSPAAKARKMASMVKTNTK